jgi:ribosomal protein S18 acetylase RimI-like enzyme
MSIKFILVKFSNTESFINKNNLRDSFEKILYESFIDEYNFKKKKFKKQNAIDLLSYIQKKKGYIFLSILKESNQIISLCCIEHTKKSKFYINSVMVKKEFRNKKLCQKMLQYIIRIYKEKHNSVLFELIVSEENMKAISCYSKVGFIIKDNYLDQITNKTTILMTHSS